MSGYDGVPPCRGIDGFIQPAGSRNWQAHASTMAAQTICRELCPAGLFRDCAIAALSAGGIDDEAGQAWVADGVVMAGVVCRGDRATERALQQVLAVDDAREADRLLACVSCRRPMCTRRRRKPGHVVHETGGRCARCHRAVRRKTAA